MPSKTVLCFLCGKYSKIPIRDRPTRINIQNIIDSAKHRLLNKCCGKYEKCEQWSKCKVEDLIGMSYHRSCYKDFIRSDLSKSAVKEIKLDDFVSNYIEYNVIRSSRCIDIKTITSEYMSEVSNAVESTIKKKVKSYLQNRSDILILKPLLTNQSEVVVSKRNVETVFFTYYDNKSADENDFDTLGEAFEKARNMLLVEPEWQFEGDFKTFKVNDRILTLFKILIGGKNPHSSKTSFIDRAAMLLVFWMLQNIGTYIKGSGLPQLWIESGIYSACVVEKMLAGKQMKRAIEAHTTLVLALCNIFISKKIDKHSKKDDIVECIRSVKKVLSIEDDTQFRNAIESVTSTFSSLELDKLFNECGEQSAMETFILNYIKQFEVILQYIRSTRDADIDLHLDSMSKYLKYFFAHNNLSYSRLLPLQLHAYQKIKLENSALWNEFKDNGNFVVTKNYIKFTSIGLDHGLEQEIKKLKIVGGIKGETQKGSSLDRYFTIAPALISIVNQFTEICIDQKIPTKIHHELIGGKSARMVANVGIITDLLNGLEIGLETVDTPLCNVFTKEIVPTNIATDILRRDILGEKQYIDFITDRLVNGKKSVWEPMKKSNIATFLSTSVSIDPKKAKLKMIKEDCNWFQRFTIASRSRSELDLKDLVSRFEFGAVPRSLFAHDGNLLLATDKSRIVHVLEDMSKSLPVVEVSMCDILIIDGMALLHKIKKGKDIVNCMDLSDLFIKILRTIGDGFFEIHLVMDRYLDNSLKNQTRAKRATKQARQFVISSNTNIQNVTMKELLSHSKTKRDLIAFLCNQTLQKYWDNRFCVTFGNETQGNFAFHSSLKTHSQEEADTLMVLHASTVEKSSTVIVDSPDTDVLLLLLHFMPYLPDYVLFRTGTAKFRRNINVTQLYHCIGPKLESVIVFHALTGTDMTGKFSGISKEAAFKRFLNAPEDIINKLQVLGDSRQTADSLYENVVPFVCNLYKTPCHTVEDARWYLFLKEAVPEEMPPIRDVLMQHFLRAHYMSMIWKNALNPHYSLPNPCNYGWKSETDRFMPILSNQPLCPPKLQDMVICKSCKTGCDTRRCVCFKVGMPCTEMCGCHLGRNVGCKNLSDIYKNEIEFDESDESDQE